MVEVICGNTSFKPENKAVKVEADERKIYKNEMTLFYDANASQAESEVIPIADTEENPFVALSDAKIDVKRFEDLEEKIFSNAVDMLKLLLCHTPEQIDKSEEERLDLREFTHIFVPSYKSAFKNTKTNEAKALMIDCMTGKTQAITQ